MAKKVNLRSETQVKNVCENKIDESGIIKEMMEKKYPDKMLFDIKTVSEELNCSYEFIRVRTANGTIKSVKLGASKMIPRNEFIKLLTKGV